MRAVVTVFVFFLLAAPAVAASGGSITYYLDGARIESEHAAIKGYLELRLPGAALTDSLRLKPLGNASISRVELLPDRPNPKREKEAALLAERKALLEDRMKALETREEIFRSAAKSQSGKAPRKTKTNPAPLAAIREGTDFALEQLEQVYRARRKAESGIRGIDERLAALKREGGGSVARVWLGEREGRVRASYLLAGKGWRPLYDFRLIGDGRVEVTLYAELPAAERGAVLAVLPASMAEAGDLPPQPLFSGNPSRVFSATFPAEGETLGKGTLPSLSFTFRNLSRQYLPPGEASCYLKGEYLGKAPFGGAKPDESKGVVLGK